MPKSLRSPALIFLFTGVLLLLGPTILIGRALFWGVPSLQFVPWWLQAWRSLLAGEWPLWNPLVGMGAPLLANYQLAFFYPPNWLNLVAAAVAGAPGIAWMQVVLVAFHLGITGIGMVRLTAALGFNRLAQTVSCLSFVFSAYLITRAWFFSINAAVAWLPWILLEVFRLSGYVPENSASVSSHQSRFYHSPYLRLVIFLTLQLLAGHAQITWYSLLFAFFWLIFWILRAARESRLRLSELLLKSLPLGAAVALAVLVSSIQLLPTAEYLLQSQRASAVDYEAGLTYSLWPWRLLGFLSPELFGSPRWGDYWGYANFWEDALYIGIFPFLLACAAIFRAGKKSPFQPLTLFLAAMSLASLLLALGKNLPLYPFLYRYVPTFDMFQGPSRWSILAVFSLCLLAGIGSMSWSKPQGRGLYWLNLGMAGALAISLGAVLGWFFLRDLAELERLVSMARSLALTGLFVLAFAILTRSFPDSQDGTAYQRWTLAAGFILLLDLLIASAGMLPTVDAAFYRENRLPANDPLRDRLRDRLRQSGRVYFPPDVESELKFKDFFSFRTFYATQNWDTLRESLLPNINILDEIPLVNNFDPIVPGRYSRWLELLESLPESSQSRLLNLSGAGVVVNLDHTSQPGFVFDQVGKPVDFRWVPCAVYFDDEDTLFAALRVDPALADNKILLAGSQQDSTQSCVITSTADLEVEVRGATELQVQVTAGQPGWLYQSDIWYPGWRAQVDGIPVDLVPANGTFRAVALPAGQHIVRIYYAPLSFFGGAVLSGFGLLIIVFLLISRKPFEWKSSIDSQ